MKKKNENENFQLLQFNIFWVKKYIGGFPYPCTLQICKGFPTKIIIVEERSSFLHLIDVKNRPKTCFFSCQSGAENLFVLHK